nr:alkaline phosphatase D family protein [uncultured Allomuricauda sp.]
MRYPILFLGLSIFLFGCKAKQDIAMNSSNGKEKSEDVFVVSFGSCNKQYLPNPFWDDILAEEPDVWIWGGDIVYADTDEMDKLKAIYAEQSNIEGYKLLRSKVPVIGTWDDHDYGLNDGGEEFSMKKGSQQLLLDFLEVPKDDKRRSQEGVYASHLYETTKGKVKVLVLDTRYFRSQLEEDESPHRRYKANSKEDATILGSQQWEWLENELQTSDADFNLILSSIQVLSQEHGFEGWGNFPREVERLNQLIVESEARGVMVLSGDRHISEFSKIKLEGMSYPLIDFTSSGLTHSYAEFTNEHNPFRVGKVISVPSFGIITLNFEKKEAILKIMGENGVVYHQLKQAY